MGAGEMRLPSVVVMVVVMVMMVVVVMVMMVMMVVVMMVVMVMIILSHHDRISFNRIGGVPFVFGAQNLLSVRDGIQ